MDLGKTNGVFGGSCGKFGVFVGIKKINNVKRFKPNKALGFICHIRREFTVEFKLRASGGFFIFKIPGIVRF